MRISNEMFTNPHDGRISASQVGFCSHPSKRSQRQTSRSSQAHHLPLSSSIPFPPVDSSSPHALVARSVTQPPSECPPFDMIRLRVCESCLRKRFRRNDRYVRVSRSEVRTGDLAQIPCAQTLTQDRTPFSPRIANPTPSYGVLMGVHVAEKGRRTNARRIETFGNVNAISDFGPLRPHLEGTWEYSEDRNNQDASSAALTDRCPLARTHAMSAKGSVPPVDGECHTVARVIHENFATLVRN